VFIEYVGVAITELLQKAGRALDIGEKEGYGAGRQRF
jgi:hypothetical protein